MENTILKVSKLAGTPVFVTYSSDARFSKIFGATQFKDDPLWYFPAYYPLYKMVLKDIRALKLQILFSEAAQTLIEQLNLYDERVTKQELPANFVFKTTPFAHQLQGSIQHTCCFILCLWTR
jgi:hypothetical protein